VDDFQEKSMLRLLKVIALGVLMCIGLVADAKTVYVDTPGLCYHVEKVDGTQIYLTSTKKNCKKLAGKVPVEIDDAINEIILFTDGALWKEQNVSRDVSISHITDILKKGKNLSDTIELPDNAQTKEAQERAEELAEFYHSEQFQCTVNDKIEGLKQGVFKSSIEEYYEGLNKNNGDDEAGNKKTQSSLSSSERIYIFISSSVAESTLRNYAADLDKLNDSNISMVLRGLVGGMKYFRPTLDFVTNVIKKHQNCNLTYQCETYRANIQIDPLLFRRYGIKQVPAIVYVPDIKINDSSLSEGLKDNAHVSDYYVVYGDTSFEYALELIQRKTKSRSLKELITAMRKGFY
jgi:conjugal transfer pilus assembly protein TrbC